MKKNSAPLRHFAWALLLCGAWSVPERAAAGRSSPWWDQFPTLYQTGDVPMATRSAASGILCGAADDPTWGLFGQRQRILTSQSQITGAHDRGMKVLAWFEGFGTAGMCYVAEVHRRADGGFVRTGGDDRLTRLFHSHWDWQNSSGEGEVVWVGAHNTFDDDEFARPYTRMHPRYGMPPMRYPNGRVATGALDPADPRTHRVYDAGASKDVLGHLFFEYEYNDALNRKDPLTGTPAGPQRGVIKVLESPGGVPDPGYTPDQWRVLKRPRYSGAFSPGKDSACPLWIDYARGSVRQALDAGIDGLWVDNWSPWDSFNARPVLKAFGEWSVDGFRQLKGIDIRQYLQAKLREWGGDPFNLDDPKWLDARWRDDAVWRSYLIYKRRTGADALSAMYRTLKGEAAAVGKPDFLVSGNDIPGFSLGWTRGDLDMVSTELGWGWGLTTGPRGVMPPPHGSYVPVYLLAREHARSRFVTVWMYGNEAARMKPGIASVCYYQGLANHALPMPLPGSTLGTEPANAEFFGFVRRVAPEFADRRPVAEVGLYYSSSSQLLEMVPGGFRNHADQPHSFSFYGWGAALTMLHSPWRAIPEWKLTQGELAGLKILIIPSADVFPKEDVPALTKWVNGGGVLVIAGACGERLGESGGFDPAPSGSTLAGLEANGKPGGRQRAGRVLRLPQDPGRRFYKAEQERPGMLKQFAAVFSESGWPAEGLRLSAPDASWMVGLTLHEAPGRLFLDVNNTDIDMAADRIHPSPPTTASILIPESLRGKQIVARAVSPDAPPSVGMRVRGGSMLLKIGSVARYASIILEAR